MDSRSCRGSRWRSCGIRRSSKLTWERKMSSEILRVDSLHAAYGKVTALNGVSIQVNAGEIVAILGANGAGKTTLLNCITGVVPIAKGGIFLAGKPIHGLKPWTLSR